MAANSPFLTDPFLQFPTPTSVRVVWFTEFRGDRHWVRYGDNLEKTAIATTSKLSRTREDRDSQWRGKVFDRTPATRNIWRHEAEVTGLKSGDRVPYYATSIDENGDEIKSDRFTLAPTPPPGQPLKILLTSDHQLKPLVAANLQKVREAIGRVDAVFLAGDLVNIPDRASEWFDDDRGGAFFPALQGRASYELEKNGISTVYKGGEIIQHAPLFPAIGNHEVMGRFSPEKSLNVQFEDAIPRAIAEDVYSSNAKQFNPSDDPEVRAAWIKANSFNVDTYREIFSLPDRETYYAVTFGDVRLVVLYVTNIWRLPGMEDNIKGRYKEADFALKNPQNWGYGQHIFEPINKGSAQYRWLETELNSEAYQQAKYKIVMFHHPPHTLGENIVPPYTDPVQKIDRDENGNVISVRYDYPKENDYIIRDVLPLLETANVDLVFYGHSHLWNRFFDGKIHFLETSNVGNTYGAATAEKPRPVPDRNNLNYAAIGNPNGLDPAIPTIAPLRDDTGVPQPYIASNDITVFSIFDTGTGKVSSYYFDTRQPNSDVVQFDEFGLKTSQETSQEEDAWLLAVASIATLSIVMIVAWFWRDAFRQIEE